MASMLAESPDACLERSCGDWMVRRGPFDGVELLRAWFHGQGFSRHRHDTYGLCVTETGVQTFDYRGRVERSVRGYVTVLHPDEPHDGRAGSAAGFGYRIVYVEPARIADAVRAITGRPTALPFVPEPVLWHPPLARAITAAFAAPPEPLALDAVVLALAEGILDHAPVDPRSLNHTALARARAYLEHTIAVVPSADLESLTGLTRYELARQFRARYGTSPHRYSILRRLDVARHALAQPSATLSTVAQASGFADQAHFTRLFKSAFGLTPGRYEKLQHLRV